MRRRELVLHASRQFALAFGPATKKMCAASVASYNTLQPYEVPPWARDLRCQPPSLVKLAVRPTPIHPWDLPGVPSGFQVSVKRDDMTGSTLSGNKVRKLEFLLADALRQGCDCVVTCGGLQSNHARSTAMAARQLGLSPHLMLRCQGDMGMDELVQYRSSSSPVCHTCCDNGPFSSGGQKFMDRLDVDEEWSSPYFLTHPNGYKLSLNVIPNGVGEGEGTHVSTSLWLSVNQNPNLLWPLSAKVKIELLNQLKDECHCTTIEEICEEPEPNIDGFNAEYVAEMLASHTDLHLHEGRGTHYLKDDCIYVRVSVELPESHYKPWLCSVPGKSVNLLCDF